METECYPCIPMHSASNQKSMNHSTVTMIKQEPLSEDVNIVVDEQPEIENHHRSLLNTNFKNRTSSRQKKSSHFVTSTTSTNGAKFQQQTVRLTRVRKICISILREINEGAPIFEKNRQIGENFNEQTHVTSQCRIVKLCTGIYFTLFSQKFRESKVFAKEVTK